MSFHQPTAGMVSLCVYELNGELWTEVKNGTLSAGMHSYDVDPSNEERMSISTSCTAMAPSKDPAQREAIWM